MTSLAFAFAVLPLAIAVGAGVNASLDRHRYHRRDDRRDNAGDALRAFDVLHLDRLAERSGTKGVEIVERATENLHPRPACERRGKLT
jgi:hypothetical protein